MKHHIRIQNFSALGGEQHATIAVPHSSQNKDQMLVYVPKSAGHHPAFKLRSLGSHTDLYLTRLPMGGEGPLQNPTPAVQAELVDEPVDAEPFEFHPWCSDSQNDLQFVFAFAKDGAFDTTVGRLAGMEQVSASPIHREFRLTYGLPELGYFAEMWATYFHKSPVVWVDAVTVWNLHNDPRFDIKIDQLWIGSGERFQAKFRTPYQASEAAKHPALGWACLVAQDFWMRDASALDIRGQILCTPADGEIGDDDEAELSQLMAAFDGRAFGLAHPWDGPWMSHGNLPRITAGALTEDMLLQRGAHHVIMREPRGRYQDRPFGCDRNPGRTGDQEDFGSAKGTHAVVGGDVTWIDRAEFSVMADFYRGYMRYEQDASIVTMGPQGEHPNIRVYNNTIHYRTSSDQLGKPDPSWGEGGSTGWSHHDNQHDSNNNLTAYYLLTGDRRVQRLMEHRRELYNGRITPRMGAVREVGRMSKCMANLTVCGIDCWDAWKQLALDTQAQHKDRDLPDSEVFVLGTQLDARTFVTLPNGDPLTSWNAWEHGLFAEGWYAALKVFADRLQHEETEFRDWCHRVLRRVCRTVTLYGTWQDGERWEWANNVAYVGAPDVDAQLPVDISRGNPLPSDLYKTFYQPGEVRWINFGTGSGVDTWTRQALLIGRELERDAADPDNAVIERVDAVIGNLDDRQWDRRSAEWICCVRE